MPLYIIFFLSSGHRLTEISLVAVHIDEYKLYCRTLKKKLTEAKDNEIHKLNLDYTYPRLVLYVQAVVIHLI